MTQLMTPEPALSDEQTRRLEDEAGLEFVDGQFKDKPVSIQSSGIAGKIIRLLGKADDKAPAVEIYPADLAYRCHPDKPDWIRKPDVSVIRTERLADMGDVGMMPIPADLAVEVLSPTDLARDVNQKVEEYRAAGFHLVWVVTPETQTVDIYRADGSVARLHADDQITAEPALTEFRCMVSEFFV